MRVYSLDVERADESLVDMWEVADKALPSADEPAEFSALNEMGTSHHRFRGSSGRASPGMLV